MRTDDTLVEELRVRGVSDHAQGESVGIALERVSWPETAPDEQVFIRHLTVRARLDSLVDVTQEVLREALARARTTRSAREDVVRFPDRAALLAALTEDLVERRAARRWFWSSWRDLFSLPVETRLELLWSREPERLGTVARRLASRGTLAKAWSELTPAAAESVFAAAARAAGVSVAPRPEPASPVREEVRIALAGAAVGLAPALARWRAVLRGRRASAPEVRLAALLVALEGAPLALRGERAEALVAEIAERLVGGERSSRRTSPPPPRRRAWIGRRAEASPAPLSGRAERVAESADRTRPPDRRAVTEVAPWIEGETIATESGGFVYLVNFLSRPEARTVIERHGWFDDVPHGWHLLHAATRALGLDEKDELDAWLVSRHPDVSGEVDVGPLTDLGRSLYGAEVWNADLICARGLVRSTETHVDVQLPLSAVRLELRLAGLDLDPGWVPWLGRVMRIHFSEVGV